MERERERERDRERETEKRATERQADRWTKRERERIEVNMLHTPKQSEYFFSYLLLAWYIYDSSRLLLKQVSNKAGLERVRLCPDVLRVTPTRQCQQQTMLVCQLKE